MTNKFDWQTEDDFDWDSLPRETHEESKKPPRRWPMLLAVLALLFGAGAVVVRQVQQRAAENTSAMRADVISSHNLFRVADQDKDEELFLSLLSGRDSDWVTAQQALFKEGLLRDRRPFGLAAQDPPQPGVEVESEVTFAPDLLSAELATAVPYAVSVGSGLTETVTLQETAVYRLGRERWLRSPPDPEFWGPLLTQRGRQLALTFPERDAAVAERLLPDLERKLGELCDGLAGLACAPGLEVELQLSSDPATLAAAAQPPAATGNAPTVQISLPTPTLIGLPLDEAGYQALFRGYAAQVATAVIAHVVGYPCCAQAPLFQALVEYQLGQLSLRPWPVTEADYARVVEEQVRLQDLAGLWNSTSLAELYGEGGWRVYTAVDYFLTANPDLTAAGLQRELARQDSFYGWLNSAFAQRENPAAEGVYSDLMRDWWMRGYTVAESGDSGPASLPEQDIYLTCVTQSALDEDVQIATLHHFDARQETWQAVYDTSSFLLVSPLPGDDTLLQQEFRFDDQRWTTDIRRAGQTIPLLTNPDDYTVSFGQTDPAAEHLAAFSFPAESSRATIAAFALQDCSATGCASRVIPGIPIWSPDGRQALFTIDPDTQLGLLQTELRTVLFDERAPTPRIDFYVGERSDFLDGEPVNAITSLTRVANGHAPFWIDNNTVGYLTLGQDRLGRTSSLVTLSLAAGSSPQIELTIDDLLAELGLGGDSRRMWWIHYVMVHPADPQTLYVVALHADRRTAHVFSFDRGNGEVSHLLEAGYAANHSLGLGPDGRHVVLTGMDSGDIDNGEENALIQVYDTVSQKTVPFLSLAADFPPFSTYDWSADGAWLALMLEEDLVGLYAPDENQLRFLETPAGACAAPAWINR